MLAVQGAFFFLVLFLYEFHCFAAVKRLMEPLCDNFRRTKAAAVGLVINHDPAKCSCFFHLVGKC